MSVSVGLILCDHLDPGPAAVAGDFADLWIHMAGPVLGALAGVAIYAFLRDARDSTVAAVPTALTENQEAAR